MNFGKTILKYRNELLADLRQLMEIKSVYCENPEECKRALEFMLKRAADFGLVTKNIAGKAGHAQLGNSGRLCGALTHLDVVPAGGNWTVEPFTLTKKNGRLYGRGIADDKGASIVDLYCLRAIKEAGIEGKNTVRVIFGTDEEVGMSDMGTYFEHEPLPEISFTPDSDYGICYAEKGILQIKILGKATGAIGSLSAGSALNAVPDFAQARTTDGKTITASGRAAHACMPYKGENAVINLLDKLESDNELLSFIRNYIGRETDGSSLGIKMSDEPSGELTCCLGKLRINKDESYFTLDIRYPVTKNGDNIFNAIKILCKNNNLEAEVIHHSAPLYLPKDSETVKILSKAYREITGKSPSLYATGGGTYARKLGGKGAAFGPAFSDDNVNMHNADESIDENNFFLHAQICLQAIYEMYTTE